MVTMYNLRNGTELFDDKANKAAMKELTKAKVDNFETYLSAREDHGLALESKMKITDKGEDP